LLNDRLKVTVGSSFGLEGPQQKNQEASTIAGDVAIEYQLSKDGRYKLKVYQSISIKWRFKAKWLKQELLL
jgi:DUF4097 and DUF4098 domain-containing protein YvlB